VTLGKLIVKYSNKEIFKKAYDQNRAMEEGQALIQARVTETAYGQMQRYAIYFGLGLLAVMGGVLWVLLYLDREVSRKSDALESINNELENRVHEEIRKNRDKEQMMIEQSKMAAMGEMIGAIAHQWRQPLNALGLYIQDLDDAQHFNELNQDYIRNMINDSMRQINFMSKTIDDFRNFFKPSKMEQHFLVRQSIDEVLQLIGAQFDSHHISQIKVSGGEGCSVKGFKNEFEQVILNILTNAKDAFLEAGQKGFDIETARVDITIAEKDGTIVIEIIDNAGGIEEGVLDRVFEPYFTTKEQGKGTGIGLYMSKTIIEQSMNGTIKVENIDTQAQRGAKFTITLTTEDEGNRENAQ
jgi:signal transduction histidine kinase